MNITRTLLLSTLAALGLCIARPADAQTYTFQNLASFTGGADGSDPRTRVTLIGNTLYGTTDSGGANGAGTVFSLPASGGAITTLAPFSGTVEPGPSGLTLSADGQTLYGTTVGYGTPAADSDGAVFSVPIGGGPLATLASFNGANGEAPFGGVILSPDGSTLYGVTQYGGNLALNSGQGYGEIYSAPATGGAVTVLSTFNSTNGELPLGGLTLIGSTLYGTASAGGANNDGNVFSVPIAGGAITDLADFNGTNGTTPQAGLTLSADGTTFYGITPLGGANSGGTVFSLPVAGGKLTTLGSLTNGSGSDPSFRLALSADGQTLFGTTDGNGRSNRGTVFSLPTAGGTPTTLFQFTGANGSLPQGGVTLGPDGTLYGTTSLGGSTFQGNVYALIPVNPAPEPSQFAAFAVGLLGLGLLTLKARRRTA